MIADVCFSHVNTHHYDSYLQHDSLVSFFYVDISLEDH